MKAALIGIDLETNDVISLVFGLSKKYPGGPVHGAQEFRKLGFQEMWPERRWIVVNDNEAGDLWVKYQTDKIHEIHREKKDAKAS